MFLQISDEEVSFLTNGGGSDDDNVVIDKLLHPNTKLLLVSEGSKGCRYYTKVKNISLFHSIHIVKLSENNLRQYLPVASPFFPPKF